MRHFLGHLFDKIVSSKTDYFEAFIVALLLLRGVYIVTTPPGTLERLYAPWLAWAPPPLWLALVLLAAAPIVWGLASPHPPTDVKRRARAIGLFVAGLYYAALAVVMLSHRPDLSEATMQWGFAAFCLIAASRLLGIVHANRRP